jgi:ribosomal protein S27AE
VKANSLTTPRALGGIESSAGFELPTGAEREVPSSERALSPRSLYVKVCHNICDNTTAEMSTFNSSADRPNTNAMSADFLNPPMCANIIEGVQCANKADRITCGDCYLVLYCSEQCQSSHAAEH